MFNFYLIETFNVVTEEKLLRGKAKKGGCNGFSPEVLYIFFQSKVKTIFKEILRE